MKSIEVSADVFSMIWRARAAGEETEDEILRRVLGQANSDSAVYGSKKTLDASQDGSRLPAHVLTGVVGKKADEVLETGEPALETVASTSLNGLHSQSAWWKVVHKALEHLGGESELHYLYREVRKICSEIGKRVPKELEATIRGTLEDNSAESHRYKYVRDVFCMPRGKGQGIWAIK